jgi:hypothetical protein
VHPRRERFQARTPGRGGRTARRAGRIPEP